MHLCRLFHTFFLYLSLLPLGRRCCRRHQFVHPRQRRPPPPRRGQPVRIQQLHHVPVQQEGAVRGAAAVGRGAVGARAPRKGERANSPFPPPAASAAAAAATGSRSSPEVAAPRPVAASRARGRAPGRRRAAPTASPRASAGARARAPPRGRRPLLRRAGGPTHAQRVAQGDARDGRNGGGGGRDGARGGRVSRGGVPGRARGRGGSVRGQPRDRQAG